MDSILDEINKIKSQKDVLSDMLFNDEMKLYNLEDDLDIAQTYQSASDHKYPIYIIDTDGSRLIDDPDGLQELIDEINTEIETTKKIISTLDERFLSTAEQFIMYKITQILAALGIGLVTPLIGAVLFVLLFAEIIGRSAVNLFGRVSNSSGDHANAFQYIQDYDNELSQEYADKLFQSRDTTHDEQGMDIISDDAPNLTSNLSILLKRLSIYIRQRMGVEPSIEMKTL